MAGAFELRLSVVYIVEARFDFEEHDWQLCGEGNIPYCTPIVQIESFHYQLYV